MTARDLTIPNTVVLDLETSGLYREDLSMDDPGQPWAIQIAAVLCNGAGLVTNAFSHIVKADNRRIKEDALKVHGISDRAAAQVGVHERRVLGILTDMLKTASMTEMRVVTYGDMDRKIIASLLARYALLLNKPSTSFDPLWLTRPGVQFINLQRPYLQQLCQLPGEFDDYRWPTLDEAAQIILGRKAREGHHDAYEGCVILKDLFVECARRGLISEAP